MFKIATTPLNVVRSDLLILCFSEFFVKKRKKVFDKFPKDMRDELQRFFSLNDFKGKFKEKALFYPVKLSGIKRIAFLGLGNSENMTSEQLRQLGYETAQFFKQVKVKQAHFYIGNLDHFKANHISPIIEGIRFSNYSFNDFKSKTDEENPSGKYTFLVDRNANSAGYRKHIRQTSFLMNSVNLTRDLANQPANHLFPDEFSKQLHKHFHKYDNITIETLDKNALIQKNFKALLAVGKGSARDELLLVLKYQPKKQSTKKLAIVGKGVTFDTGGISIKPAANMEEMKFDMAGAASVAGIMDYAANIRPNIELIGVIPLVENMPGEQATRPGDIVTAYNGTTIEIINTDAEGRLILADAMAYTVDKFKPDLMINMATLTGSCVVALGDKMAGMFSNSDPLAEALLEAGAVSGDLLWKMPLSDLYSKELESKFADIKNVGGRYAGAISAALFLQKFVGKTKWAHIDIAGTAYNVKEIDYLPFGSTGFGTRLLAAALPGLRKLI